VNYELDRLKMFS